jgi:putative transposase
MTTDRIALCELLEKGSDIDLLREMIGFVAERLMALEVEGLCGAGHGERTPARTNQRNGFRDRAALRGDLRWSPLGASRGETRAGTVDLKIPKLRKGASSRASLSRGEPPRRRSRRCSRKLTYRASRAAASTRGWLPAPTSVVGAERRGSRRWG